MFGLEGPAPLESDLGGPAWANLGFFGDSEAAVRMLQVGSASDSVPLRRSTGLFNHFYACRCV